MVEQSPPRLQFSLRWLFVVVTATAVCALVYRLSGLVETVGVAVSLLLCGVCLKMPRFRHSRWLRGGLLALATIVVWMVGVDGSVFWEGCQYCGSHSFIHEFRLFHQPVWSRKGYDHQPTLKLIAEDLGSPCPHQYQRSQKDRQWGLIWPGPPLVSGVCCLEDGDWYVGAYRDHVRTLGVRDPQIGKDFQKALLEQNHQTVKKLLSELRPPPGNDAGATGRDAADE